GIRDKLVTGVQTCALPIYPAFAEILGETCYRSIADVPTPIDTVTMYLGSQRSDPLIGEIIAAKPRRILFNPGAENDWFEQQAERSEERRVGKECRCGRARE